MSMPHDRPTIAELIDAVRAFLADDVVPGTEGRMRFHARVAANALTIVARELEHGDEQAARHRARLDALGFDDDEAFARAIRSGRLDERYDEVAAAVRAMVADKLTVANPGYPDG